MSTAIITRRKRAPAILEPVALWADARTDAASVLEPRRFVGAGPAGQEARVILWAPTSRPALGSGRREMIIYADKQS